MLATLDWWVIGTYLFLLLALGGFLSRRQHSGADYFAAGRNERPACFCWRWLRMACGEVESEKTEKKGWSMCSSPQIVGDAKVEANTPTSFQPQ